MKKLVCAAIVAGSMFAMAEEAAKPEAPVTPPVPMAPAGPTAAAGRGMRAYRQLTPEQREKMRERREKTMAERREKTASRMLEIVRKYVPDEEQAKALVKELQDSVTAARHVGPTDLPRKPDSAE